MPEMRHFRSFDSICVWAQKQSNLINIYMLPTDRFPDMERRMLMRKNDISVIPAEFFPVPDNRLKGTGSDNYGCRKEEKNWQEQAGQFVYAVLRAFSTRAL